MNWKQPTPTDINNNGNLTAVERSVFREILSLCQNKDYLAHFIHAERHYSVELKRGQCIFKVARFANDFEIDWKRIRRSVEIISKWYTRLESRAMPFGLIITVKDYDDIVGMENGMENRRRIEGEKKENRRRANKSDKNDKNDKKNTHTITPQEKKVLEIFNRVQEREGKDKFKSPKGFGSNLVYWLEDYSLEDIERAVLASRKDSYWQDILTPTILLRQKNERKEPVDYIGDLKSRGASKRRQGLRPNETYGPDGSIRKKGGGNK